MFIRKLTKALLGFCLLLCLSACSDRAEFEQRFAKVGEVYPTENVSDLFKKFPDGFRIYHKRYEYVNETTYYHSIQFEGDGKTKKMVGSYEKYSYDNNMQEIVEFDKPVDYIEGEGLKFRDGSIMDPFMTDFQFAFEWLELNQKKLSQLEYRGESENPASGGYGLYYYIEDEAIYDYFNIINRNKLVLSLNDYKLSEGSRSGKYSVEISVFDRKEPENTDYFLESIGEK